MPAGPRVLAELGDRWTHLCSPGHSAQAPSHAQTPRREPWSGASCHGGHGPRPHRPLGRADSWSPCHPSTQGDMSHQHLFILRGTSSRTLHPRLDPSPAISKSGASVGLPGPCIHPLMDLLQEAEPVPDPGGFNQIRPGIHPLDHPWLQSSCLAPPHSTAEASCTGGGGTRDRIREPD